MSLRRAGDSTGGPSAFLPAKQGFFGEGPYLCCSCISNISYLVFNSYEDHIIGQKLISVDILKIKTEFWVLFQGDNIQGFVNICK